MHSVQDPGPESSKPAGVGEVGAGTVVTWKLIGQGVCYGVTMLKSFGSAASGSPTKARGPSRT